MLGPVPKHSTSSQVQLAASSDLTEELRLRGAEELRRWKAGGLCAGRPEVAAMRPRVLEINLNSLA